MDIKIDPEPMSDIEKTEFFVKLKRMNIPTITPDYWQRETGLPPEDLIALIRANFRLHNIRDFLTGSDPLGRAPKLIIFDGAESNLFLLVSIRPDVAGTQQLYY